MYGKQHPHASNWSTRAHSKRLSITHDVTEASHAIQKSHLILVRMQELCHTTRMRTAYLETRTHYVGQSCNAFDSYSEGVRFESRRRQWVSSFEIFIVFLSPRGKHQDSIWIKLRCTLFAIHLTSYYYSSEPLKIDSILVLLI